MIGINQLRLIAAQVAQPHPDARVERLGFVCKHGR
jgi:hypothetical protein